MADSAEPECECGALPSSPEGLGGEVSPGAVGKPGALGSSDAAPAGRASRSGGLRTRTCANGRASRRRAQLHLLTEDKGAVVVVGRPGQAR